MKKITEIAMNKSDMNHKIDTKKYCTKRKKGCSKKPLHIALMGMLGEINENKFCELNNRNDLKAHVKKIDASKKIRPNTSKM